MQIIRKLIVFIGFAMFCIVCIATRTNTVTAELYQENGFPEGTIVIPRGTDIRIDDNARTVVVNNCPVNLSKGVTFVVYLQDLPIAYVAESVMGCIGDDVVIVAHKADEFVYAMIDEKGEIALTPDMYEFMPAPGVTYSIEIDENNVKAASDDPFIPDGNMEYKDGILKISYDMLGMSIEASFSGLCLSHYISDGNIGVELYGEWEINTKQGTSQDLLSDLPLGEIRIGGVGKVGISISFKMDMDMTCHMKGTFSVGIGMTQDGEGTAKKGFTVTERTVEGKGSITASFKISAGVDVLVASADLFLKIGLVPRYATKDTYHKTQDNPEKGYWVHCDDITIYAYAYVGIEGSYYNILLGKMTPVGPNVI